MGKARKLFRLFKTLQEIHKIHAIIAKGKMDQAAILNLTTRVVMCGYWIFDNLNVLSQIKFVNLDAKKMAKYGSIFWFISIILTIAQCLMKLAALSKKEAGLLKKEKTAETQKEIGQLKAMKMNEILTLVKQHGDIITASSGANIA